MGGGKTQVPKKYQPPRRQQPPPQPKPSTSTSTSRANTSTTYGTLQFPINWAPEIKFLTSPSYSKYVKPSQLEILRRPPPPPPPPPVTGEDNNTTTTTTPIPLDFPTGPNPSVQIQRITDPNHPAYGQCGLFAARDLLPGELILPYYGVVHPGTETVSANDTVPADLDSELKGLSLSPSSLTQEELDPDARGGGGGGGGGGIGVALPEEKDDDDDLKEREKERMQHEKSDYDLWLSREADLAVDGEIMGNEARFINDYRGVPGRERENAELRVVWDERIVHRHPPPKTQERQQEEQQQQEHYENGTGTGTATAGERGGGGGGAVKRGEWTMAVYVLPLSKKARLKLLQAQAQAEELQKKKLQQAQKKNKASSSSSGSKKAAVGGGGGAITPATSTKMSSVGVIKKGEEILVSYGRGFWERRREEARG